MNHCIIHLKHITLYISFILILKRKNKREKIRKQPLEQYGAVS